MTAEDLRLWSLRPKKTNKECQLRKILGVIDFYGRFTLHAADLQEPRHALLGSGGKTMKIESFSQ